MKWKEMISIGMAGCELGVEVAKVVAEMAAVGGSLTQARWISRIMRPHTLPFPQITHILYTDTCVRDATQINLRSNNLGPEGAKALVDGG
eukprot:1602858-Prymnesium_polylepis.1